MYIITENKDILERNCINSLLIDTQRRTFMKTIQFTILGINIENKME